ncbi:hypothetical protein SNE40_010954 [Patella caerulea]|uniref:Uncharacterized protein n=1 Tax=Patella caerulea TaxID=87958 RepID=A0AAN8PTB7_PATCE
MADEMVKLKNREDFFESKPRSATNDPWNTAAAVGVITPPTSDPAYQFISSERYLNSLESKLSKIKGKSSREPSAKEIISSLGKVKDDHMNRFISDENKNNNEFHWPTTDFDDPSAVSYFDRLLHPERQAVSGEELIELLKDDALSRNTSEQIDDDITTTELNENMKNVDQMKQNLS